MLPPTLARLGCCSSRMVASRWTPTWSRRAIRPNTLTRKNALFAGNDSGAVHWAVAMTLIPDRKIERRQSDDNTWPMCWNASSQDKPSGIQLHTLLPWNWTASTSATITSQAA